MNNDKILGNNKTFGIKKKLAIGYVLRHSKRSHRILFTELKRKKSKYLIH